jgi:hypothetical protein
MPSIAFTPHPTPNPKSYKFVANRRIHEGPTQTFYNAAAALGDPVAARLFASEGVTGVMILNDFCSVNQDGSRDWSELAPQVQAVLQEAYAERP